MAGHRSARVLRHVLHEDMGAFGGVLDADGWDWGYDEVPIGGPNRDAALAADLLVVLGGPCGAYEGAGYPWLAPETALIADRIRAGGAVLGVCLGAQLIAAALGARVYPGGAGAEIGWGPVDLTAAGHAGPLAALDGVAVIHWHGDTYALPSGAVRLASTPRYAEQAFAIGANVLGLQFHPEVDGSGIEHWLIGQAGTVDVAELRAGAAAHGAAVGRSGAAMFRAWLAQAGVG